MWCLERDLWISAAQLPGKSNSSADKASRICPDHTEWKLDPKTFTSQLRKYLGVQSIDLFASRLNFQTKPYIAWHPDPGAFAIDAFSPDWGKHYFYPLPLFNLTDRVLQKVEADKAPGILIVPQWTTQPWFPVLMHLLVQEPLVLPRAKNVAQPPYNLSHIYPLTPSDVEPDGLQTVRMSLKSQRLSEQAIEIVMSSWRDSTKKQYETYWHNGDSFQLNGLVIPCNKLSLMLLNF